MVEVIAVFAGDVAGIVADVVAGMFADVVAGMVAGGDERAGAMAGGARCRFCRDFGFDRGGGCGR